MQAWNATEKKAASIAMQAEPSITYWGWLRQTRENGAFFPRSAEPNSVEYERNLRDRERRKDAQDGHLFVQIFEVAARSSLRMRHSNWHTLQSLTCAAF
jgi:hypothetical protein